MMAPWPLNLAYSPDLRWGWSRNPGVTPTKAGRGSNRHRIRRMVAGLTHLPPLLRAHPARCLKESAGQRETSASHSRTER